jgi:hypothetical protein
MKEQEIEFDHVLNGVNAIRDLIHLGIYGADRRIFSKFCYRGVGGWLRNGKTIPDRGIRRSFLQS